MSSHFYAVLVTSSLIKVKLGRAPPQADYQLPSLESLQLTLAIGAHTPTALETLYTIV